MPKYLIITKEESLDETHKWAGYNSHSEAYEVDSIEEAVECYVADESGVVGTTIMVAESQLLDARNNGLENDEHFIRWIHGPFLIKPKAHVVEYDLVEA